MINFKAIEINDKKWMDQLLTAADMPASHNNFTNLFIWTNYNYRAAKVHGHLVVKGEASGKPYYLFPAGKSNPKPAIEALIEDARYCNHKFIFLGLTQENINILNTLFPDTFTYTEMGQHNYDYIYLLKDLATLAGRKFSAKRNHINRFKKSYSWTFELITPHNLNECRQMSSEWYRRHSCGESVHLTHEKCAVNRCFDNYKALKLEGGLLRVQGEVVAFTMGDRLNSNTYDIHVEKAFIEYLGAYQMINREFAAYIHNKYPDLIYVNREEDMGCEGLRKAKLSYYPIRLETKYQGKIK